MSMGYLTTHILDTAQGKPANGIPIILYSISGQRQEIKRLVSNHDGRTNEQLLSTDEFKLGTWELVFSVGDYFHNTNLPKDKPPFLDEITLRFTISRDDHYHVPLLVSPWSYSTYRGS
jgi:5-hydroxyisourate hydrolase